jgi:GDP-L-fucose synthase
MSDELKGSHVLVTGGAGFIGSNLIARLVNSGLRVRATYFRKCPLLRHASVEYVRVDLTHPSQHAKIMEGVDTVYMCAANSSGAQVMATTPLVHLTPNIIMNANCLAAAYEFGVKRFVFISSNTVYPLTDYAVKETDAGFDFYSSYHIVGWMKRFSEIMCDMYASKISKTMSVLTVRPGNLYGPFDKFTKKDSKVIAALIRRALEKESPFTVWGDGNDIKDFLYIDDFIDALTSLTAMCQVNGPVNIASGIPISIKEMLPIILNAADHRRVKVAFDESKPTMIPKRLIDIAYLQSLIKWHPKVSIQEGIERTIEWYRNTYALQSPEAMHG